MIVLDYMCPVCNKHYNNFVRSDNITVCPKCNRELERIREFNEAEVFEIEEVMVNMLKSLSSFYIHPIANLNWDFEKHEFYIPCQGEEEEEG